MYYQGNQTKEGEKRERHITCIGVIRNHLDHVEDLGENGTITIN
jgi:hypothetical protein